MQLTRHSIKRLFVWALFALLALAAVNALFLKRTTVRAHEVTHGTILVEAFGTGSVESRREITVGFEITGRVATIDVDQGDAVAAGQPLATLDSRPLQAEVALAEQQVALAEATLARLLADIARSQAVLRGAEANLARVRPLVGSGAVSGESLDLAQERQQVALADLQRSEAAELEGRQAILAARKQLDRITTELERTVARSPFDGVVVRREREVGDVAVPGSTVLELAATDTIWASSWVDESYLGTLRSGQPARIVLRSEPGNTYRGSVSRIGREVDRETRELLVDVVFETKPDDLVFGQRVDLWIELERSSDVLCLPRRCVVGQPGAESVYVVRDGRAESRAIEVGRRGRDLLEVRSGLDAGELVLEATTARDRRISSGDRVAVEQPHAGVDRP